jgi:outer membrane protein W
LSDDFAIGLRLEGASLGYRGTAVDDFDVSILGSAALTGEYYLSSDVLRPFIGAGVGFSRRSSLDVSSGSAQLLCPAKASLVSFPKLG